LFTAFVYLSVTVYCVLYSCSTCECGR